MILFLLFVLGAVLGSFINVIIYRLPRKESLVRPPSHCPHCRTPIRPQDNIPLLSFLLLKGRCRHCGQPIGWRYPVVELAAAFLLPVLWIRYPPPLQFVPAALLALMLLAISFIDLEHQLVPNAISYPGITLGLLLAIPQGRFTDALFTAAGAGVLFLLIALVSRGGMGGGDIKLATMLGAFLGWPLTGVAVFAAFVAGASVGVVLLMTRRRGRKDPIPFGPALAVGGVVALLAGREIVGWYLRL